MRQCIPEDYEDQAANHLHQITLELTERCNLRCGYCIYHEGCDKNRNFGTGDMSRETAFRAIEYGRDHSGKEETLHIGFYGGEPLLCYPLLMSCITYAQDLMPDKVLYFSLTTNAVLLNAEMAAELGKIKNISITVSLDGPKEYHDMYRRDLNGGGSFDAALRGLKLLVDSFGYEEAKNHILLSMVYAPPFSISKLEKIQEFFESLSWLHPDCAKHITYPDPQSYQCIGNYAIKIKNEAIISGINEKDNSIYQYTADNWKSKVFTSRGLQEQYLRIYNRVILQQSESAISMNGCCVPGQRKVYVTVNGEFKLCEKVGNIPSIGSISDGINIEYVKDTYMQNYREQSMPYCRNCWMARLCSICYSRCYNQCGFDSERKLEACNESKNSAKQSLISYFTRLEEDPYVFDPLSEMVVH